MDGKTEELRQLAETLDEARREIDLAREQSTKPKHLAVRARQSAVQAARVSYGGRCDRPQFATSVSYGERILLFHGNQAGFGHVTRCISLQSLIH